MTSVNWRGFICAVGLYAIAAVVVTWPLAINLKTRLGALQGPGDPYLNLWILGWGHHSWISDPVGVLSGRVFDANIFFPAENTLAYSDHFLLQALALAPVYAATRDAVLSYNLLLLASIAFSGLTMHLLVRAITGSTPAACLAGLAWACWPYRTAQLLHLQLQALYFLPLALLCLHRVMAKRRWRDALGLGLAAALQAIASVYYGVMTAVTLVVSTLALAISTGQWRARRLWLRLFVAAVVAMALASPLLVPYARVQQSEGFGRTLFEASKHSASWQAYTQVPPDNLLYGRTGLLPPRAPAAGELDRRHVEHQLFPGLVVLLLAIAGVATNLRRDARPVMLSGLLLLFVGGFLSLGPEGSRTLYAWLHGNVVGFQAIRAPARFVVIAFLGLLLLAALGMRSVIGLAVARAEARALYTSSRRGPASAFANAPADRRSLGGRRLALPIIIISLSFLEYVNAPLGLALAPPRRTEIGQWLAHDPTPGAVLHVPLHGDIENTPHMVQSLEHYRPIVNGYSGQRPAFFSALVENLADFPSPTAFAVLRELDVRFVVAAAAVAGAGNPRSPLIERARFNQGIIYETRWTSEAIAALAEIDIPAPPPPGPIPFEVGESAVYEVYWDTGPLNLPAGKAVLTILDGGRDISRWQFEANAETANWVSRFYEARDRFLTTADQSLLPLEHHRDVYEGRRQLTRTYIYDRNARNVRVGESRADALATTALTLPLGAEAARDAITALYYVRTLPLTPGQIVNVPLNEGGSTLMLQVNVAEAESIELGGQRAVAIRLEPRLMRRIERRQPLAMTIWLSADDRRVPLRAILQAGFGRVRAELKQYRR